MDKAKEDYQISKNAFEEEKSAQEEIAKIHAELREKTTKQVSQNLEYTFVTF